ncbi:hypothetical protein DFH06DRAFT_1272282 [Mycena polygramma]|nr:hypothetical protein DFH06DRAFT_1272282 [Mycena polygramma]
MAFRATLVRANRAIVYTQNGDPSQVLSALTYKSLPAPRPNTVNIKYLLAPINPADINVVQGVYPAKPSLTPLGDGDPVFVGGNEGLAEVTQVGTGVSGLATGDWVIIMNKAQAGTWSSSRNVDAMDILKLPRSHSNKVNPPTAYNMLTDYVTLAKDEAVIQIAASRGLKTLNLLKALGATEVLTYDDLADRSLTARIIKDWTAGKGIRLGLNCVSGKDTTSMARLLGDDAYLVSYGAMSKEPLSLPTSLFIFKNLTTTHTRDDTENLMKTLVDLVAQGKLKEPEHEILTIPAKDSDEVAGQKVRDIMAKMSQGHYGKKVLLKLESAE